MSTNNDKHSLLHGKLIDDELRILVDSIRSITSTLNLDKVLEKIMRNALRVISATDAGYLLLYDPATQLLLPKAPIGFNENIYKFRVKPGESVTGKVFEDGIGRIFNSKEELFGEMDRFNISKTNFEHITSAANSPEAAICVPIAIEGKRIGIMITHQWRRKKILDDHDLLLLQIFAEQAAIAIQNARYYTEAHQRLHEITQLSAQLEKQNLELQKRHDVHETMTNLSLENKGLEAIIRAFDQMTHAPLSFFNVIEDKFYIHSPNEELHFDSIELKNIFSTRRKPLLLHSNRSAVNVYLYPIYNRFVFLGCFLVAVDEEITESDRITLEQGSPILVLELIKNQTVTEYFYKKTHEQFSALLDAQNADHLAILAKEFGLTATAHWFIAIFEIPSYTDLQLLEIDIHHLILKMKSQFHTKETMIYGLHNRVVLLAPVVANSDCYDFQSLQKEWEKSGNPALRGGVSTTYKGLHSIKKLYEEATKTLSYLATRNSTAIIRYEDIGLNRLFLNQSTEEIEQFIDEVFSPLSSANNGKTELEDTLLIYFETNRSATKTAEKLHIHINTLYQRIRKIEQLLQLNLNDYEDSLKVQLACHLRATYDLKG
ncbi:helix-turn-helix domain-containing protein [Sporosarcina sp. FSL K6-1522]|uniref:helix-turn-helix domain-containing protein n=1 Tax=Sporosarcina sp. FSL K6-1522 TaxID=2921554 RepID=UPI0031599E38